MVSFLFTTATVSCSASGLLLSCFIMLCFNFIIILFVCHPILNFFGISSFQQYPCFVERVIHHKVSTTGDDTRKHGDIEISNFLSLSGMVLSLMFPLCVSSRVAVVPLGGGITVCAILMTSYRPVQTSRTTNTRTFMASCGRRLHLPS